MTAPDPAHLPPPPDPLGDTRPADGRRLAVGVGFRNACTSRILADLVRDALARVADGHGRRITGAATILATVAEKDRPTLREAAAELGLPVLILAKEAMLAVDAGITVRSAAAQTCLGLPSVAEAAALAAVGPGATLLLPRMTAPLATCAVAITGDPA